MVTLGRIAHMHRSHVPASDTRFTFSCIRFAQALHLRTSTVHRVGLLLEDLRHFIRSGDRFLIVRSVDMAAPRFIFGGEVASPNVARIGLCVEGCLTAVMDQDWRGSRQHIVRVLRGTPLPASSLVSVGFALRWRPWLCAEIRGCCRRYCRQAVQPR